MTIRISPSVAFLHTIGICTVVGIGLGIGQWKHTISKADCDTDVVNCLF